MAKARIKRDKDWEGGRVTFTEIASGDTFVADVTQFFPNFAGLSEVAKRLAVHSVNAKVGDSASDPDDPAIPQIKSTYDELVAGTWSQRGEGGGGSRITILSEAVYNIMVRYGKTMPDGNAPTLEAVGEIVSDWLDEKKKEYRVRKDVNAEMLEIRNARDAAKLKAARKAVKDADLPELTL